MRWLLDQGNPRSASGLLRDEGDDACHTGECGMAKAKEAEIIELAVAEGRVIVTFDADFQALLASRSANFPQSSAFEKRALRLLRWFGSSDASRPNSRVIWNKVV
jgi:hypothetical protein